MGPCLRPEASRGGDVQVPLLLKQLYSDIQIAGNVRLHGGSAVRNSFSWDSGGQVVIHKNRVYFSSLLLVRFAKIFIP